MILNIVLPQNLAVAGLLKQKHIPCLCKVSTRFEILFREPLPEAAGEVAEWDRALLDERVPAGAGGQFTHYA